MCACAHACMYVGTCMYVGRYERTYVGRSFGWLVLQSLWNELDLPPQILSDGTETR